ncbi:recombinase family protein [Streptomyces sp. NPDC002514]|uniref:recombinase family protein n=1 Tax=Streptomyces sp. MMS24-I2-30 TaxID=3351564 RepID=UPI003896B2DD
MTAAEAPPTFQSADHLQLEPWIGYIRVSTWKEEKISPEIQRAAIEAWASQTGRRIVEWISDLDVSGRHFKRKIQRAIELVQRGVGRGIAVWKYSRFGRDDYGIRFNLHALEAVGGKLESATERIDASDAVGRFSRRIQFDLAAFESERIGEAWQETHKHRLAQGVPSAGRPRFGYIWHPRRIPDPTSPTGYGTQPELYEPHSELAPVVASLYAQYLGGTGMVALAQQLNVAGHESTRGGPWGYGSLLRYMDSGFPAGMLRVRDDCDCPKAEGRGYKNCQHWRYMDGAHLPIIGYGVDTDPTEIWEAYRARRSLVRRQPIRARHATYELTGLVRCCYCRSSMSPKRRADGRDVDWRCSRKSDGVTCPGTTAPGKWLLSEIVRPFIQDVAAGVDAAPSTIPVPRPAGPDPAVERARLTAETARLSDALARLTTDYALNPDRYPADAYDQAVKNLEADRKQVLAQLAQHEGEKPKKTAADFQPLAADLLAQWEEPHLLTTVQKNLLLRQLMRYVWVLPRPSRYQAAARVIPMWKEEPALVQ